MAAAWLERLKGGAEDLEWDKGNRMKNRKHRVEPQEIEALLGRPVLFAGRIVEPTHSEPR